MPVPHQVDSIDGTTLASLGVTGVALLTDESEAAYIEPEYLERGELPGIRVSALLPDAELVCIIPCPSWSVIEAVVRLFDWPKQATDRTFAIYVGDPSNLVLGEQTVTVSSVVMAPGKVEARVRLADPLWKAQTVTTAGPTSFSADGSMVVSNTGLATVAPTLTVTPVSNAGRVGDETALVGYKYRRPVTITNSGTEDWHEVLVPVWWGDTTGLTTAKAQASGADVRVWDTSGKVIRRQLLAWDSLATMLVFPVTIKAGKSRTYLVVYGNPAASTAEADDPEYLNLGTNTDKRPSYAACDLYATSLTATSGTTTTFVLTTGTFEANRLRGGFIFLVSGTGASNHAVRRILSNTGGTGTTITVDRAFETAPASGTVAVIWMSGIAMDGGLVTATTTTSLTDSGQSGKWGTDQWENAYVVIEAGTGAGASRLVTSSTNTGVLNWSGALTLDTTSRYRVIKPGYQTYMVDRTIFETAWRGLWWIDDYFVSPKHRAYGDKIPAGWIPFTRYQNEDNFAQPPHDNYGSGGGHNENWFPNGRIRRQVRQDRHYGNHKQADGFGLTDPRGIDGIQFDYQWKNVGGICAFVFGVQRSGSEAYSDLVTNSTTQTSLTDVAAQWINLTGYGPPVHVAFNVGPVDGVLIPNDTPFASEAEWRTKTRVEVWISPALMGGRDATYGWYAVGTEEEAYDANMRLQIGTRIAQVGGLGRHLLVPIAEDLVIRTDPDALLPVAGIYSPLDTTLVLGPDAFTAADGTALETYNANWVKHTSSGAGSATIDGNRAHNTNDATIHTYYRNDLAVFADGDVSADLVLLSDNNLSIAGVAVRIDTAANTMYFARYATGLEGWQLWKVVAGVFTQLGSTVTQTLTVGNSYTLRLVPRGSLLRVYRDGTLIITQVDTAITAAGRAGLRVEGATTSTTGIHLDNWAVYQDGEHVLQEETANQVRFLEEVFDFDNNLVERVARQLPALAPGNNTLEVAETAMGSIDVSAEFIRGWLG